MFLNEKDPDSQSTKVYYMLQKEALFNRMGLTVQTMKALCKERMSMAKLQDE